MFRLIGLVISLGLIGYLLYGVLSSDSKVGNAINANPAVQEQKRTLESAGVNASDQEALKRHTLKQARELEQYMNQAPPPQE